MNIFYSRLTFKIFLFNPFALSADTRHLHVRIAQADKQRKGSSSSSRSNDDNDNVHVHAIRYKGTATPFLDGLRSNKLNFQVEKEEKSSNIFLVVVGALACNE